MEAAFLRYVLRRALTLPPHVVAGKALGLVRRRAVAWARRRADQRHGSHSRLHPNAPFTARLRLTAEDIPPALHEALRAAGQSLFDHRFDLLGSGPVEVAYGAACAGYCSHRYGPGAPVIPDGGGLWLDAHVNRSNRDEARRLWRLIGNDDYRPIDWQLDFRSGYRWRGAAHIAELSVPVNAGADVKVPWELGRLQHLPQFALCAIVAAEGGQGFAPAERYVR